MGTSFGTGIKRALCGGLFLLSTAVTCGAADYVNVSRDGINLRSGPGTKYEVLFELPADYPLKVLETKGDWLKVVDYENDRGYIHKDMTSKSGAVIVKVREANVRKEPSTKAEKVGTVAKDVILKAVEKKGDWIKVTHPKLTGWIHRKLVWP